MAITTVETVNIKYNEVTVDTYGLSDTLDTYTIDDIKNYVYCSCTNKTIRGFQEFVNNGDITMFNDIFPFYTTRLATNGRFLFDVNAGSTLPIPDGAYVFTVWLQCSDTLELTSSNIGNAKLVTSMNAPRMKYTLPNPVGTKDNVTTWSGGDGSQCYQTGSGKGSLAYVHNIDAHNTVDIGISNIHPYMLIVLDDVVFFWRFRMDQMKFLSRPQNHGTYGSNFVGGRCVTAFDESTYSVLGTKIRTLAVTDGLPYDWGTGTGSSTSANPNAYGTADDDRIIYAEGGGNNNQTQFGCVRFYWYPNTRHEALLLWAGIGVKFYGDKLYKPIIENGYVTGYTDNMDDPSELDDWDGDTKHTVPSGPPGPPGPDGDDPWHGIDFGGTGAGGGGAFCSVYYMTGAQLASLKNWSNTSSPEGFDMLPSIIGLQQLPVAVSGIGTTVKFLKSAAITSQGESRLIDTGVAAGSGTGQPIPFSLGHVNINRRMQQRGEPYLDYDCTVELFLPFAGTFVLDTQAVMGRTISAEIIVDPVNGTAFAYAWVENGGEKMPIAYGGGSIAVDLPIASNQWGISRAAFKQQKANAIVNAIKDVGNFIIGAKTWKTGHSGTIVSRNGFATLDIQQGLQAQQIGSQMMTSSTINAATNTASSIISATQLNNTNYTAVNGSFGGSYAEWSQPFQAYVRITRPKFKKPDNFNHTEAVPCVETKTLGHCTGLTICVNPDCGSVSCTEAEKIMIAQALAGGVYAGGGS